MSLYSSLFRASLNRKNRRATRNGASGRLIARVKPNVECLEDRVVPASLAITDPYTLYTFGDAYTGAPGQDRQSFMATYHPFDTTLSASFAARLSPTSREANDPGSPGPFAVTTQEYNLGDLAFRPTDSPWASSGIELTGEIKAPTDLGTTAHPVIVLMHGRHVTTYDPVGGGAALEWPPTGTRVSIPSYRGYDYLGDVLASQGYVVVSIGTNGINARDNGAGDAGALARAQLMQRTFGILEDLNRDGVISPRAADPTHPGTDLFTGSSSPFGTRFVAALNLQNIGIMGHSRGGEGVVRSYNLNLSLGSPYGIKAVFALAPIDATNSTINNVPFAVLLPYNDGDVSNLEGAHFFDDSRYNVLGDTGLKYSIEVMGANHNFYNTVWSPGLFPFPGAPAGFGGTSDDGNSGPPSRLTETQQQGTGLAYMSAFFRTYVGGETQFLPILTGDAAPPPSATVTPDRIHLSYLPPEDAADRRDVNRLLTTANLTTNTLGGAVVTGGLGTYNIGGPISGEVNRGNQLSLNHTGGLTAFYENDLPAAARDERSFNDLQFRIGVNFADTAHNPPNTPQDFSVELDDGSGNSHSVLVSAYSNDLFDPPTPSSNPHEVLNTVRIPLGAFVGFIDLSNVTAVRFNFDQHPSGAYQIADLAFADPASSAGPYVVSSTPAGNVVGAQSSVRVRFDRPIDRTTFTTGSIDSFTRTVGSTVTDLLSAHLAVTPVAGSNDQQFDITFDAQSTLGAYQLVIGPNILDLAGNPMDQNHNLIAGEIPDDEYTAAFSIVGPKIIASTDQNGVSLTTATTANYLPGRLTAVLLTFNEPIDPATFNRFQAIFTSPTGPLFFANSVTPIAGSGNTRFSIQLSADANTTGAYTLTVVPTMQDMVGNQLDQNGNFIGGEIPADEYILHFNTLGPKVNSSQTVNVDTINQIYTTLRVTFNEAMAPASFTPSKVQLTDPGGAVVPVTGVVPVSGSNNTQFDIVFPPQGRIGAYTVVVGPNILDPFGNAMDQNGNLITGEIPGDQYSTTFTINGPKITATVPIPNQTAGPEPIYALRVTFSKPIDVFSFTPAKIASFSGPGGPIGIDGVFVVPGSTPPNSQFDIYFPAQVHAGIYTMVIGPDIRDLSGNQMDQDGDLIPGEVPSDQFTATFNLAGPMVASVSPSGSVLPPVDHVRVTFNEPINPATFTTAQVTFTGPGGPIDIAGVTPVAGSNNTQFDVGFDMQTGLGAYTIVIGPGVMDPFGESAPQFTHQFTLVNQISVLYGSTPGGQLFSIDLTTGAGTLVGNLPFGGHIEIDPTSARAFVQAPDGAFFGREFNPATGAGIGNTINDSASFTGLDWVGTTLYATAITGPGGPSTFRTLNPFTGSSTIIGSTGFGPISGLAFDQSSGIMYGITGGSGSGSLVTINLTTGAATSIGATGFHAGALHFGPDGLLYGGGTGADSGKIFRINPATGVATLVGFTGIGSAGSNGVTGLAIRTFVPSGPGGEPPPLRSPAIAPAPTPPTAWSAPSEVALSETVEIRGEGHTRLAFAVNAARQLRSASAPAAADSGVISSAAGSPGAAPIDAAFARTAAFSAAATVGAESAQLASNYNDLVFSPNQGDRWRAASSTPLGQVQIHSFDEFDPFADSTRGDIWWWV